MTWNSISKHSKILSWLILLLLLLLPCVYSACGDCVLDSDEECDDCNKTPNDGCSPTCTVDTGYYCIYTGNSSYCVERCGDGINVNNTHACDDGNNLSEDGCSATCQVELGFTCTGYGLGSCTEDCDGTWKYFLPCDGTACCDAACTTVQPGCTCIRGSGCQE